MTTCKDTTYVDMDTWCKCGLVVLVVPNRLVGLMRPSCHHGNESRGSEGGERGARWQLKVVRQSSREGQFGHVGVNWVELRVMIIWNVRELYMRTCLSLVEFSLIIPALWTKRVTQTRSTGRAKHNSHQGVSWLDHTKVANRLLAHIDTINNTIDAGFPIFLL